MVTPSIQDEGKRVAAVRFGTTWAMQLLMALGCAGLCFGAFSNQDVCRTLVEQLGVAREQARPQRVGYELRKLRGKGLVHKARGRNRYTLTPLGQKVVPALVKFHQRLLGPTLDSFDEAARRQCQAQSTDGVDPPEVEIDEHALDRLLRQLNRDMDELAEHTGFSKAA
jgi:DNA-binding MarR family transcriptional regulator